ncbi:hypothetical protein [Pantoea sp.]|uniref:hypothetical protein n=1 Tax=Pantoea sp. TaxID=69393 RepID=UPI0031D62EE9
MYAVSLLTRSLALMVLLPLPFAQAADTPELTGVSTNPLSITRIHDRVNFMVSLTFNNGKTAQQWRSVDCKQGKAQLLYKDLLNDKGHTIARYYGNSYLRYAPPQDDGRMTQDDIRKVCRLPIKAAQWEKLSATSEFGMTDLVDVSSIKHSGDMISVRLGYDFADITWEPPYDAPLELKIEQYLYNCKTHQGDAVALMNVDGEGRVTDSLITADIIRRKSSFPITPEMERRFQQICQLPAGKKFKAEGRFVPAANKPASTLMGPTMPDLSGNNSQWLDKYPLTEAIERQAQSLITPWALPRFKQVRYTEASALGKINVQLDAQPNGYVRKLEDYGLWKVQRLTLANQLQLKFTMSISTGASLLNKLQTDLRFPLVTGQHYQARWDNIDAGKKITSSALTCDVTAQGEAKSIAPEFGGKYLLVTCDQTAQGQVDSHVKLAWLQDLNIFVPLTMQEGNKPESAVKLENVRVIR